MERRRDSGFTVIYAATLLELGTKDLIEAVLKHLTDRIALAALFASSISFALMLVPGQLGVWMTAHWVWPFLGLLFSLCYLPTRVILDGVSELAAHRKRCKRLKNLTRREKEILAPYIRNDFRTRRILHTDPVAKGLERDGVLYQPGVVRDNLGHEAYSIPDWVRTFLKKHSDTFEGIPNKGASGDL